MVFSVTLFLYLFTPLHVFFRLGLIEKFVYLLPCLVKFPIFFYEITHVFTQKKLGRIQLTINRFAKKPSTPQAFYSIFFIFFRQIMFS